jgi:ABC-type Fe3+-hydroxamate transport system substrate-binding protein
MTTRLATFALPLAAALALAACAEAEDTTYEVDATDEGGGELIVTEQQPEAVEVDTPDTPMTNVPEEDAEVPAE